MIGSLLRLPHEVVVTRMLAALDSSGFDITVTELGVFLYPGPDGRRPGSRQYGALADDPHFRDHVLFHEYFDGDDGRGLGASHQTGWTGLIAKLLQPRGELH